MGVCVWVGVCGWMGGCLRECVRVCACVWVCLCCCCCLLVLLLVSVHALRARKTSIAVDSSGHRAGRVCSLLPTSWYSYILHHIWGGGGGSQCKASHARQFATLVMKCGAHEKQCLLVCSSAHSPVLTACLSAKLSVSCLQTSLSCFSSPSFCIPVYLPVCFPTPTHPPCIPLPPVYASSSQSSCCLPIFLSASPPPTSRFPHTSVPLSICLPVYVPVYLSLFLSVSSPILIHTRAAHLVMSAEVQ